MQPFTRRMRAGVVGFGLVAVGVFAPVALAGGAPSIAFTPSSHDYATTDPGTTASQTFVLTNTGGSATGALTVSLSGSSAMSVTADGCTAKSLGPRKSCSVTVRYAPTTVVSSDTGTLTAMSKKPSAIATASLSGTSGTFQDFQLDCEAFGGTFATGIDEFGAFWTCGPLPLGDPIRGVLGDDCFAGGGDQFGYAGFGHPEDAYICLFD